MREILQSMSVLSLKREISKTNIKGYSKMKKAEVIDLMMKPEHRKRFSHLAKKGVKKERLPVFKKITEKKPPPKKLKKKLKVVDDEKPAKKTAPKAQYPNQRPPNPLLKKVIAKYGGKIRPAYAPEGSDDMPRNDKRGGFIRDGTKYASLDDGKGGRQGEWLWIPPKSFNYKKETSKIVGGKGGKAMFSTSLRRKGNFTKDEKIEYSVVSIGAKPSGFISFRPTDPDRYTKDEDLTDPRTKKRALKTIKLSLWDIILINVEVGWKKYLGMKEDEREKILT